MVPAKIYHGRGTGTVVLGKKVTVSFEGTTFDLTYPKNIGTGDFNWGFKGTGPSNLAYAMLFDYLTSIGFSSVKATRFLEDKSQELVNKFVDDIISQLPQDSSWDIPFEHLDAWVNHYPVK